MILVLSNHHDTWTNRIVEKFHFNKKQFSRINTLMDLETSTIKITLCNKITSLTLNAKVVKKIWIRKKPYLIDENLPFSNINVISKFYQLEFDALYSFALCLAKQNGNILGHSHYNTTDINKLFILHMAAKHGLKIPYTIITNNKDEVIYLIRKVGSVIMKPMSNCISYIESDRSKMYKMFTSEVDQSSLKSELFFPTMFQEKIKKKSELRVFYLNELIIALRIYSQNNIKTMIDIRNYDHINPNKTTLIQLPDELQFKIIQLMKSLNLNTASIDLIENEQDEHILLDINPYGMVGHFDECDIDLAELIYKELVNVN
jgi:glutathione synthase/RimK-type ligase-like ATP-grasp enzyme